MTINQTSINVNSSTPLGVAQGGSAVSSPTQHGILIGEGSSPFNSLVLSAGQVAVGTTGSDPAGATISGVSPIYVTSSSGAISISPASSGVTAGSYTSTNLTVDAYGRITTASNGSGGGSVTAVTASSPLTSTGGSTPNLALSTSGVTAASYTNSNITVNAQGIITAASNGSGGGASPVNVTSSTQAIASGTTYIANFSSAITFTVPVSAAVGAGNFTIIGSGAGGWILALNSGQRYQYGNVSSSITSGTVTSTNQYDCINGMCTVANTTFVLYGAQGNQIVV